MLDKIFLKLINLPKILKVILQINYDFCIVLGSLILMKTVDLSFNLKNDIFLLLFVSLFFSLISFLSGSYKSFVRFFTNFSLIKTFLITTFTYVLVFFIFDNQLVEPFIWISALFFTFSLVTLPRLILREPLRTAGSEKKSKIAIIGNDYESYELLDLVKHSKKYQPICFIVNQNKSSFFKNVSFPELNASQFLKNRTKLGISLILASETTIEKPWFNSLLTSIENSKIPFYLSRGVDVALNSQKEKIEIYPLSLLDLAIRSPQPPVKNLLKRNLNNKTVMITGGGGSIGSELCKQILLQIPKKIIIVDSSEFNLYQIEEELKALSNKSNNKVQIIIKLCSVLDKTLLSNIFESNKIDTVFHAAAFKHVPMVEKNPLAGFENNVLGTKNLAELAIEFNTSNFTLISTDKAVNPTNIMGVSKRLAEMVCQSLGERSIKTTFAIVRFGNVLGSSGSVIPKFEKQIATGGPITVTHKNIIRYFMSITEAAELVIQASAMAKRCEFFVLDMGNPVKIFDLAKRLCSIRGLSSYCITEGTFSGDIEIRITELRSAEKMYEEVLATNRTESTEHPRIFSAKEEFVSKEKLFLTLDQIIHSIKSNNGKKLKEIFSELSYVNYSKKHMLKFCKNLDTKLYS